MWRPDHHNTETLLQCGEINEAKYVTHGAMRALDPRTGERRDIVPDAPGRTVRDPQVDWDGRRIVFSMRNGRKDDYHIYTVNPDGSGLVQLKPPSLKNTITAKTQLKNHDDGIAKRPLWRKEENTVFFFWGG